jgi:hypothetical protein
MPKSTSQRTFTACWTCRSRGVRCDTKVPSCTQCSRSRLECEGYDLRLVWVDSETGHYEPQHRRAYSCERTWLGYPGRTIKEINHLISSVDSRRCRCRLHDSPSPFGTLELHQAVSISHLPEVDGDELVDDIEEVWASPHSGASPDEISCISVDSPASTTAIFDLDLALPSSPWSLSLPWVPGGSLEENELFYHYISALAPVMTPIDDEHNPWNSTYPRLATQWQTSPAACSLLHAILAQSAFQRANLGQASSSKYLRVGTRNYVLALRHLRHSLNSPTEDFSTNLAAMLTVTIAGHCFEGQSEGLTHHVEGAIQFVTAPGSKTLD